MKINNEKLHKYLKDILTLPSPTGYTYKVIDYISKELDSLGITYKKTNKGALSQLSKVTIWIMV